MRKGFNFYNSYWEQMKLLDDKQKLQIFNAICEVQFLEKNINDIIFKDKILILVWTGIKHSLETSLNGYLSKQKALNKDIEAPLSKGLNEGGVQQVQEEEKEEEKEKVQKSNGFKKPSISEIQSYIQEKSYSVNAETFYNFYESNGWKVGKNKMKSWKASVSTWNSKNNVANVNIPKAVFKGGYN